LVGYAAISRIGRHWGAVMVTGVQNYVCKGRAFSRLLLLYPQSDPTKFAQIDRQPSKSRKALVS
jgi:hypothetical protein